MESTTVDLCCVYVESTTLDLCCVYVESATVGQNFQKSFPALKSDEDQTRLVALAASLVQKQERYVLYCKGLEWDINRFFKCLNI